ncbi:hypothetical protein COEREDRAFT_8090 [Coemansia reversa NRRL 1564]|uniref:Uncharacterized protein n=1 Tax=Coemansia reversa (strain ATCC 12441 / NRRL 1564) TaxID=763665 RepID=A0A2G5BD86_COERN|nr:hypothetical protein COEREDRAFT_8090 [Coemansia reversa NRRL 1564]|eukprot:PIA16952.1 hypothetical protein COEREDRAFT_8090 [Coemansia reversa NRRL 1564]
MSPSTNSRTEVANSSYSAANFASIYATLDTFCAVIQSNIQEPEELDDVVRCVDDTTKLKDLALRLLAVALGRKTKIALSEQQWPKLCSDLAASTIFILKSLQVPEAVADSLDAYIEQSSAVRVDVLYWLCEVAVMDNPEIKVLVDSESGKGRKTSAVDSKKEELVRLQPYFEISKQRYWLFGNKTRQLYLESLSQRGRGKLELLAQTPAEFSSVVEELNTQRNHAPKELADLLVNEVVPFLEQQARKRERVERALQRQAIAIANVHIYETRTRKRQRVNYNVDDGIEASEF